MEEEFEIREGETLKSVLVLSDDDVKGAYKGEYGSYAIIIETSLDGKRKRKIIKGCHDMGPDLEESK